MVSLNFYIDNAQTRRCRCVACKYALGTTQVMFDMSQILHTQTLLAILSDIEMPSATQLKSLQHASSRQAFVFQIDQELLNKLPNLKLVATASVGYEHLNIALIRKQGIRLTHTPNTMNDAGAELGMTLMLAAARHVVRCEHALCIVLDGLLITNSNCCILSDRCILLNSESNESGIQLCSAPYGL